MGYENSLHTNMHAQMWTNTETHVALSDMFYFIHPKCFILFLRSVFNNNVANCLLMLYSHRADLGVSKQHLPLLLSTYCSSPQTNGFRWLIMHHVIDFAVSWAALFFHLRWASITTNRCFHVYCLLNVFWLPTLSVYLFKSSSHSNHLAHSMAGILLWNIQQC